MASLRILGSFLTRRAAHAVACPSGARRCDGAHRRSLRATASFCTASGGDDTRYGNLYGSTIVTRLPSLTPDRPDWMVRYEQYWLEKREWNARRGDEAKVEQEVSKKKSKAQQKKEKKQAAREAAKAKADPDDPAAARKAAQRKREMEEEAERARKLESTAEKFVEGSRTTEADRTHDVRSLDRALSKRLYLIVRPRSPTEVHRAMGEWMFPFGQWKEGESMRKTAHRNLRDQCGKTLRIYIYGNAPSGHYEVEGLDSTLFFHQARYLAGKPRITDEFEDYAWVTKAEMGEYFREDFYNFTQRLLWE